MADPRFRGYQGADARRVALACYHAEVKECPKDENGHQICNPDSPMWREVWAQCPKRREGKA